MIEALAMVIAVLVAVQPSAERQLAGATFAAITLVHLLFVSPWADGHVYFLSAAFLDVTIMLLISRIRKVTSLTITIYRICIAEILVNAAGWVTWMMYLDLYWYSMVFVCLHAWAIVALTRKDKADDVGGHTVDSWRDNVRLVFGSRISNL